MTARQTLMLLFYLCFLLFTITQLPGSISRDFSPSRLHAVIALDFSSENSILLACFLLIGVYQLSLAGLLLQARSVQRLPGRFFAVAGFFCGYYVSGLYQALRVRAVTVRRSQLRAADERAVESRVYGLLVLCAAAAVHAVGAGAFGRLQGSFGGEVAQMAELVKSDRLVAAVVIDLLVTAVLVIDPVVEDMQRRGWSFCGGEMWSSVGTALAVVSVPGVGVGAYLMVRPRLPEETSKGE